MPHFGQLQTHRGLDALLEHQLTAAIQSVTPRAAAPAVLDASLISGLLW